MLASDWLTGGQVTAILASHWLELWSSEVVHQMPFRAVTIQATGDFKIILHKV